VQNPSIVFVIHDLRDRAQAQELAERLKNLEIKLWWTDEPLDTGSGLESIRTGVEKSQGCLVLVSAYSSRLLQDEKLQALLLETIREEEPLVPVMLRGAPDARDLPSFLRNRNPVDLREAMTAEAMAPLVRRITGAAPSERPGQLPPFHMYGTGHTGVDEPVRQETRTLFIPDIDWVEIPRGPFIYQSRETRELPTFWIARYPITNVQFQTFIDDGGYREDRWWQDLKKPEVTESRWSQVNRPRTDVDWYEAVAFTRWLNAQLGLPEGSIRLPTELEWEKAARGEKGLVYPWGREYLSGFANVDEKEGKDGPWYLEQTTAVGLYPQGRSPYGVEDLAGTVWEWCLNKHNKPEDQRPDTSGDARVLRGGSWFLHSGYARADNRGGDHPGFRTSSGGSGCCPRSPFLAPDLLFPVCCSVFRRVAAARFF